MKCFLHLKPSHKIIKHSLSCTQPKAQPTVIFFFFFSRYVSFYFYFSIFTRSIVVFPSAEILSYHTYTSGRIPCTGFAEKAGFCSPQVPTFPARTAARPPFSTSPARPTHAHQISRGKTISGTNISTTCCTWMCYL